MDMSADAAPPTATELLELVPPSVKLIVRERISKQDSSWSTRNDFDTCLTEVLRYLYLISKAGESRFVPLTEDADTVWHELILQTAEYHDLCDRLPGRRYIHHTSEEYASFLVSQRNGDAGSARHELLRYFVEYVQCFGVPQAPAAIYWTPMLALEATGASLDQLAERVLNPRFAS